MADSNRVSIPRELVPHIKSEAESLLMTDDLTAAVAWILRKYFRDQALETAPTASTNPKAESLADYEG